MKMKLLICAFITGAAPDVSLSSASGFNSLQRSIKAGAVKPYMYRVPADLENTAIAAGSVVMVKSPSVEALVPVVVLYVSDLDTDAPDRELARIRALGCDYAEENILNGQGTYINGVVTMTSSFSRSRAGFLEALALHLLTTFKELEEKQKMLFAAAEGDPETLSMLASMGFQPANAAPALPTAKRRKKPSNQEE